MTMTAILAFVSTTAAILWLGIIVVLHLIKPELDPRTRMISEYAREPHGWIMQLAFFSMAASCWALAAAIWTLQSIVGPTLLGICGVGFAGAGVFITDPVSPTEKVRTRSGALHVMFAFGVMLVFPVAATLISAHMADSSVGAITRPWLLAFSMLAWVGLFSFVGAVLRSSRQPVPVGYFERFLVVTYTAWLALAGLALGG
jgi:Protein of unknown function (DUF998)